MKNDNEPTMNGATIVCAVIALIFGIYIAFSWSFQKLGDADNQRAQDSLQKTAGRRESDRANREQEKRAELLDFIKQKGLYGEVPEKLKVFEHNDTDKDILKDKK